MDQLTEQFGGGLVTARSPLLLQPGECQTMNDLIYRPGSQSPQQAPGRAIAGGPTSGTINGIRHCAFDNDLSLLVVQASGAYFSYDAVNPTAPSSLGLQPPGTSLNSTFYNGLHFLFNGQGPNQVLSRDGSMRRHGLAAITAPPGVAVTTGHWPLIADTLPAYYEYWYVEAYINDTLGQDIEGTFISTPVTVYVPTNLTAITVTRGGVVNPAATHWRLYRSPAKYDPGQTLFPSGFLAAEVPIAQTSVTDGGSTVTSATLPGAVDTFLVSPIQFSYGPKGNVDNVYDTWTSKSAILSASDVGASASSASVVWVPDQLAPGQPATQRKYNDQTLSGIILKNFGFTNIGAPITDITLSVKGQIHNNVYLSAHLSWDGGITWTTRQVVPLTAGGSTLQTVGGLWERTWSPGEVLDADFRVILLAINDQTTIAGSIDVDYIKVTLTHSGTSGEQTIVFPAVSVVIADVTYKDGSRGEPPAAKFGDVFEDSLVVNDPDNGNAIRYSLETLPEAFPPEYFLPFVSDRHDRVTAIKSLGRALIVGLNTYLARVDYLPRGDDADFSRGRAWDIVQGSHGIVGSKACCSFFLPGQGLYLAYVSLHGPLMTNGYWSDTLSDDLNWASMVNLGQLATCEFINHPAQFRLMLLYPASDGTRKCLVFYYHPSHIKNGKLKVSGPLTLPATSGSVASLPNGDEILYTTTGNNIYVEDSTTATPFYLLTREIQPGGPGNSAKITKALLHQHGGGVYTISPRVLATNVDPRDDNPIVVSAPSRGFVRVPLSVACEGIEVGISGGAAESQLDLLLLEGMDFQGEAYPA